jgi:hypothetical protein
MIIQRCCLLNALLSHSRLRRSRDAPFERWFPARRSPALAEAYNRDEEVFEDGRRIAARSHTTEDAGRSRSWPRPDRVGRGGRADEPCLGRCPVASVVLTAVDRQLTITSFRAPRSSGAQFGNPRGIALTKPHQAPEARAGRRLPGLVNGY